ncbi:bombyxin F-1-like, partial [Aphis gossypii]
MKLIKVFFVFLIQLLDIFMASPVPALYMETPVRFCGQQLAVELSIICKGRYNEARGNGHRHHKRGIIDDCCLKTCTRQYVKINYCGPEPAEPK